MKSSPHLICDWVDWVRYFSAIAAIAGSDDPSVAHAAMTCSAYCSRYSGLRADAAVPP